MPIYEYICDDCGEHYERIVLNRGTVITCPKCASAKSTIKNFFIYGLSLTSLFKSPVTSELASRPQFPVLPAKPVNR